MIVNHRPLAPEQTEYTMAMDKVEFIAIQCALKYVLDDLKKGHNQDQEILDLAVIYAAAAAQMDHPTER